MKTNLIIVDDFYENPDAVREYALKQNFDVDGNFPGKRTKPWLPPDLKQSIQFIVQNAGGAVTSWREDSYTGSFQYCLAKDRTWIHADPNNTWAGVCYLTPNAPLSGGTALYRHNPTGKDTHYPGDEWPDGQDYTQWTRTDYMVNKYNRLVLYRGMMYHASVDYFGNSIENGRLFQTFFFDTEF